MASDPIALMEEALGVARAAGIEVTGWTLQHGGDGFIAWVHREDEEGQWPIVDVVDTHASPEAAAASCLQQVREL